MISEAGAVGEEGFEEGGDWAEQPRQISKRTRNARRTIINRSHLSMGKPLDYLMAARPRVAAGACRKRAISKRKENKGGATIHLTLDRKSIRLNSSHLGISYAVF